MPSWVPDWSQPWRGGGGLNVRWRNDLTFRAAGNTKAILIPCQDQNSICLKGFRLDVVQQSGGVRLCNRRTEDGSPFITEDSLRADIKVLGLEDRVQYDLTREKYVDAYLRTITYNLSAFSSRLDDQWHAPDRPAFYAWIRAGRPGVGPPEQVWHEVSYDAAVLMGATDLFISEKGLLGLGPKDTNAQDIVCIFLGGNVPFVLRARDDGKYQLVGECYVHGVMDGEALKDMDNNTLEDFVIT
jgi:hypothetical protein